MEIVSRTGSWSGPLPSSQYSDRRSLRASLNAGPVPCHGSWLSIPGSVHQPERAHAAAPQATQKMVSRRYPPTSRMGPDQSVAVGPIRVDIPTHQVRCDVVEQLVGQLPVRLGEQPLGRRGEPVEVLGPARAALRLAVVISPSPASMFRCWRAALTVMPSAAANSSARASPRFLMVVRFTVAG